MFASVNDVPRKFSQAKGELVPEVQKSADNNEQCSKEKKGAADIAKRVHKVILPEAADKASDRPLALTEAMASTKTPDQTSSLEEKK